MPQPTNTNKSISSLPRGLNSQVVARPTVSFSRRQAATSGLTAQSFAADGSNVTTGEIDPSVLPLASSSTPGIVEPDNTTITVDPATGIITAVGATSTLVVTDGTTTITPTGMITFVGAVVTGTTPNAVVTITGGGSGTVTSVGLSLPAEFTVTGTPVTTSGTLTATWATESANLVFAGPSSGSPATPTFRSLQTADYPNNSVTYPKIQQVTASMLLGNPTGSTANVQEIGISSELQFASGILGLYHLPVISGFTTGVPIKEIGSTVTSVPMTWSYNKTMTTASLNNGIGSISAALTNYTDSPVSLTTNTTFTLTAGDGVNTTSASSTVTFENMRYWGPNTSAGPLTSAQIIALGGSEFSTTRVKSGVVYNCTGGAYPYYAYPASFGALTAVTVGGLSFSAYNLTTQSFTNASGATSSYFVFVFQVIQTGAAISVSFT